MKCVRGNSEYRPYLLSKIYISREIKTLLVLWRKIKHLTKCILLVFKHPLFKIGRRIRYRFTNIDQGRQVFSFKTNSGTVPRYSIFGFFNIHLKFSVLPELGIMLPVNGLRKKLFSVPSSLQQLTFPSSIWFHELKTKKKCLRI